MLETLKKHHLIKALSAESKAEMLEASAEYFRLEAQEAKVNLIIQNALDYHRFNPSPQKPGNKKRLYANPGDEVILFRGDEDVFHLEAGKFNYNLGFWFTTIINLKTKNKKKAKEFYRQFFNTSKGLKVSFVSDSPEACRIVTRWEKSEKRSLGFAQG